MLIFPTFLDRITNPFNIFSSVVLVEIRSLDISRGGGVWIIQETI